MKKVIYKIFSGVLVGLFLVALAPAILAAEILATPLSAQNLKTESVSLDKKQVTLRILNPSEGKMLRYKISGDIFNGIVYLGCEASMDDFEEVDSSALAEYKAEKALEALKNLDFSDLTDLEKISQAERALETLKRSITTDPAQLSITKMQPKNS